MEKMTQYARRQAKLTEEQKAEERRIRNAKDRVRREADDDFKLKAQYRTAKSQAKSFVLKKGKKEDLKELQMLLNQRLKEI